MEAVLPGGYFTLRPQTTLGRSLLSSAIRVLWRGSLQGLAVWVTLENGGGTRDGVT